MKKQRRKPPLVAAIAEWRKLANLCESEIQRTITTPPTLILSRLEKARYEQAAITFRVCADALTEILNEKATT